MTLNLVQEFTRGQVVSIELDREGGPNMGIYGKTYIKDTGDIMHWKGELIDASVEDATLPSWILDLIG